MRALARHSGGATGEPAAAVLPEALWRLIREREHAHAEAACESSHTTAHAADEGHIQPRRADADALVLADELRGLEAELQAGRGLRDSLRSRCRADAAALRELALTAAALHGRALYALEDAAGSS